MKKEYEATNYESDLTDEQWEEIKEFFPSGNKSKYHKRSLVEAVLYIVKTGCQWIFLNSATEFLLKYLHFSGIHDIIKAGQNEQGR